MQNAGKTKTMSDNNNSQLNPELLVSSEWLEAHLDDPDLLVFDATTVLVPDPELEYRVETAGRPGIFPAPAI